MGVYRPTWVDDKIEYYNNQQNGGNMDAEIAGSAFGSMIGLLGQVLNMRNQMHINKMNLKMQKEMTEAQWDQNARAFQTAVADARKAGLSPLAAIDHPTQFSNAIYSDQVAPQLDLSSTIGALMNMDKIMQEDKQLDETKRHNEKQEEEARDRLELENEKLKAANDAATKLFKRQNAQMLYKYDTETKLSREKDSSEFIENMRKTTGYNFKIEYIKSNDEYIEKQAKASKEWAEIEEILNTYPDWSTENYSQTQSSSKGGGLFSANANSSSSKSTSYTKNKEWYYTAAIRLWERGLKREPQGNEKWWDLPVKRTFKLYQYMPDYETEIKDPDDE